MTFAAREEATTDMKKLEATPSKKREATPPVLKTKRCFSESEGQLLQSHPDHIPNKGYHYGLVHSSANAESG